MYEYEKLRRVTYGSPDSEAGQAVFVPVCPNCGRFVQADPTVRLHGDGLADGPTATCARCGRVEMPFEGFI